MARVLEGHNEGGWLETGGAEVAGSGATGAGVRLGAEVGVGSGTELRAKFRRTRQAGGGGGGGGGGEGGGGGGEGGGGEGGGECGFPLLASGSVDTCNLTTDVADYQVTHTTGDRRLVSILKKATKGVSTICSRPSLNY